MIRKNKFLWRLGSFVLALTLFIENSNVIVMANTTNINEEVIVVESLEEDNLNSDIKEDKDMSIILNNPRIEKDESMNAGQKVTYDCIWFGSYPQTEVVSEEATVRIEALAKANDEGYNIEYEVLPANVYNKIKKAKYDENDETVVNGVRYKRIKGQTNSFRYASFQNGYPWDGQESETYYYFRYDRLKWRVLQKFDGEILVLADKVLDYCVYGGFSLKDQSETWESCKVRKYLNNDFYDLAFTDVEQKIILEQYIDNPSLQDRLAGPSLFKELSNSGPSTLDKVFLLSYDEVNGKTEMSNKYGFVSGKDEAKRAVGSAYAKALVGNESNGLMYDAGVWMLRTIAGGDISNGGSIYVCAATFDELKKVQSGYGVRPAMYLDSSLLSQLCYAGMVSTDGTVKEVNRSQAGIVQSSYLIDMSIFESDIKQDILFTIYDKEEIVSSSLGDLEDKLDLKLSNVYAVLSSGEKKSNHGRIYISKDEIPIDDTYVKFIKEGYQDYIIPLEVAQTWKNKNSISIYMEKDKKDGKPYISTVYGRNRTENSSDPYIDLQLEKLSVIKDAAYDIVITGCNVESNAVYYLVQDELELSNGNGKFSKKYLVDIFDEKEPIYAYIKNPDGTVSEMKKLQIDIIKDEKTTEEIKNVLNIDKIDLFGNNDLGIDISENVPLLSGSSITIKAGNIDAGVKIEGNKVKFSIGMDIFSKNNVKKEISWEDFKKQCNYVSEKKSNNLLDMLKEKYMEDNFKYEKESNKFKIDAIGYAEAEITRDGLVFTDVCGSLAVEFLYKYIGHTLVPPAQIPVYCEIEGGVEGMVKLQGIRPTADKDYPLDFDAIIKITPELIISAGIGFKNVVSGGVYGTIKLPYENNLTEKYHKLSLEATTGIEGEFFIVDGKVPLASTSWKIFDGYYGKTQSSKTRLMSISPTLNLVSDTNDIQGESVTQRDYINYTSEWVGDIVELSDGFNDKLLQSSVYTDAQSKIVTFGDTMMMVWLADNNDRDAYNRMMLVYSVYDVNTSSWSEPKPVYDDGTVDDEPNIIGDGENVYVVWRNSDKLLESENTSELFGASEICIAKYDPELDKFVNMTQLSDNEICDRKPVISLENEKPVVYWLCESESSYDIGCTSIYKWQDGEVSIVKANENYISDLACKNGNISYIVDSDGDLFTYDNKLKINLDNIEFNDYSVENISMVEYDTYSDKNVVYVSDGTGIYYVDNGNAGVAVEGREGFIKNITVISDEESTKLFWTETVGEAIELFVSEYSDDIWNAPVQVTSSNTYISSCDMVEYNNQIYGIYNKTVATDENQDGIRTDMYQFVVDGYLELQLEMFYINESNFEVGKTTDLEIILSNNGTKIVNDVNIILNDGVNETTVPFDCLGLKPGEQRILQVEYLVPDMADAGSYYNLEIKAELVDDNDIEPDNNVINQKLGNTDIELTDFYVEKINDVYKVKGNIFNNSVREANNVTVTVSNSKESNDILDFISCYFISGKKGYNFEYIVDESQFNYDENGLAYLYIDAKTDSLEAEKYNNAVQLVLQKDSEESEPLLEGLNKGEDGKWYYYVEGTVDTEYTGLAKNDYGWWYVKEGQLDRTYTGLGKNDYGWWYVKDGKVDLKYTGMAMNENGWFYVKSGKVDFNYTGLAENEHGTWYMIDGKVASNISGLTKVSKVWLYLTKGKVDTSYTGLTKNEYGWWYVKNGELDKTYTGMAKNENGWFYVKSGKVDLEYTGLAENEYGTWYMEDGKVASNISGLTKVSKVWMYLVKGKVDTDYVGLAKNESGWWYVENGTVDFTYTGMAKNQYGWWYVTNGKLDRSFTGIASNEYGSWYIKNGAVEKTYTGTVKYNGVTYNIKAGKVV